MGLMSILTGFLGVILAVLYKIIQILYEYFIS